MYDAASGTVTHPVLDEELRKDISAVNYSIYCDKDGIVWCGCFNSKGIYQLIPFSKAAVLYSQSNTPGIIKSAFVTGIENGLDKELWISSVNGLHIFDVAKNSAVLLTKKDLPGLTSDAITALVTDTSYRKAWLLVDDADLFAMDMQTKKSSRVIFKDSNNKIIQSFSLGYLAKAKNGCIVRVFNKGIYKINKDSDTATEIIKLPNLKITRIVSIEDSIVLLRLFGAVGSITYVNRKEKWIRTTSVFDTIPWSDIFYNKMDKTYWLSCLFELIHLDAHFRLINSYSERDGLSDMGVLSVIADRKNNIWFNTLNYISMVNTVTGKIVTVSKKDGYEKQKFNWVTPSCKDVFGNIYFIGSAAGITRIQPDNFNTSYPEAGTYIQSLEINQKPFNKATGLNSLPAVNLAYFENNISIQTGIIDYYLQGEGQNRIRYKLDGIDASWQYAPANYIIRYSSLAPGNYKLFIQASNAANKWNESQKYLAVNISPAFWNTWWFRSVTALCTLTVLYSFMRYRWQQKFRLQKARAEKEKMIAEMRFKTAELEMQALRAQMNPHFIFNSLNAINHFILKNDSEIASDYLIKFSRLIRMVLNNSSKSFIPLEDELESLQLYIDLERLRFKNSFDYHCNCSDKIDAENICIPPLILQPFVENAIWHGLMHKETKGKLDVKITFEDGLLCVAIKDNGIGRANAGMIKDSSADKTKPMGLRITKNRIDLINENIKEQQYFVINDLTDVLDKPVGTMVIIRIKYRELSEVCN